MEDETAKRRLPPPTRAAGYALLCLLAIGAGIVFRAGPDSGLYVDWGWLRLVLSAAAVASVSMIYYVEYTMTYPVRQIDTRERNWSRLVTLLVIALVTAILWQLFGQDPGLWFALGGQVVCASVWLFVLRRAATDIDKVRFKLVPLLVYSVGVQFVLGYAFATMSQQRVGASAAVTYLVVILLVCGYGLIPLVTRRRNAAPYAWIHLAVLFSALVVAFLPIPWVQSGNVRAWLELLLIAAVLSVWLGSFESMMLTAERVSTGASSEDPSSDSYAIGTSIALSLVVVTVPLLLVLTAQFSMIFLVAALALCLTVFFRWLWGLGSANRFRKTRWILWKVICGYAVLVAVIADSLFPLDYPNELVDFVATVDLGAFLALAAMGVFHYRRLDTALQQAKSTGSGDLGDAKIVARLYEAYRLVASDPRNVARALGVLSFACYAVLYLIGLFNSLYEEADLTALYVAQALYIVTSIACLVYEEVGGILTFDTKSDGASEHGPPQRGDTMRLVVAYGKLGRAGTSSAIGAIVAAALVVSGAPFLGALAACAPFVLLSLCGFALNDYLDRDIDAVNKPHRAIPSGDVAIRGALVFAVATGALGVIVAMALRPTAAAMSLYLTYGALAVIYNYFIRRSAFLKTLLAGVICVIPLVFGLVAQSAAGSLVAVVAAAALLYVMSREVRMDVLDTAGDARGGNKTVAVVFGPRVAGAAAAVLVVAALALFTGTVLAYRNTAAGMVLLGALVLTHAACEVLWRKRDVKWRRRSIFLQWVVMVLGVGIAITA